MSTATNAGARQVVRASRAFSQHVRPTAITRAPVSQLPSMCAKCSSSIQASVSRWTTLRYSISARATFSTSLRRLEGPARTPFDPKPPESGGEPRVATTADLPSAADQKRWHVSRRMAWLMDSILARASVAGQHINVYTGTDYSGIEAIKKEINDQEEKVDACHATIDMARLTHHEAHAKQASSQKEIVSLLERKSSWSPEDLERYMTLVRSEHTHEQAVQAAKDGLATAERDLGNTRAELERLERKQYHEEQIWSDTIRRNSTWVTFGLMGLNIILLLTQIAIFEPYRRRKIVREVRASLDEKAAAVTAARVERSIDAVVEPSVPPIEQTQKMPEISGPAVSPEPQGLVLAVAEESSNNPADTPFAFAQPAASVQRHAGSWHKSWEAYKERAQDLFSERIVQVKKVDITTTALQGAATGVAAMGLLFVLWRPK